MRATMIAMLAAAAMGFFSPSGVSAAPANGAVIGEAAAAGQMIEKTRRYRRYPHRRRIPFYTYGPYEPYGTTTLHQLSQENQERAQQNRGGPGNASAALRHRLLDAPGDECAVRLMKARDWPCAINLFARILIQDDGALVEDPFITSDGAKIVLIAGFDLVVAAMIAGEQSPASTSPSLARIINR